MAEASKAPSPREMPWHVLVGDVIHSGHQTEEQAQTVAANANGKARDLGLKATYTVAAR